jgi:hypothetical protein
MTAVLELSQACPEESDDASEVATVMAFLRKNDGNGGVDGIRKEERRPSKTECFAVSVDVAFDGAGAGNTFLLALSFGSGVRVAAEMAFFGESAVEKNAECMEGSTIELCVSFQNTMGRLQEYLLGYYLVWRGYNNVFTGIEDQLFLEGLRPLMELGLDRVLLTHDGLRRLAHSVDPVQFRHSSANLHQFH